MAGPTRAAGNATESAWASRPGLARAVRLVAVLAPTLVSLFVTWGLVQNYPPHRSGLPTPLWWTGLFVVGTTVLLATDKVARRLLPLVALFKLSLVFPDQAPNRYSVAMRTGTTRQLERRIAELKRDGIPDDETQFATTMLEMVAALSVHDRMTRGHCERVRAYTDLMIEELKLPEADAGRLRWAALLHDVGKLFVSADILNSPNRPTAYEWEELKSHTWKGDELITPLKPWLGEWSRAVGEHHERWDGDGYPNGLAGNDIHLGARIVAVADAFDVMTSSRSYKKPIPAAEARAEIARCANGQFDPLVVRAFLNIGLGRLRLAIGPLAWLANIPAAGQLPIAPALSPVATGVTAAATVFVATVSGGFGGVFVPDDAPPAAIAFVAESAVTTTLPAPTDTTVVVTTTQAPATTGTTTTTPATTTTETRTTVPRPTGSTTPAPAQRRDTTTTTTPVTTTTTIPTTIPTTTTTTTIPTTTTTTTIPTTTTTTTIPTTTTTTTIPTTTTTAPSPPLAQAQTLGLSEDDAPGSVQIAAFTSTGNLAWRISAQGTLGTATLDQTTTTATAGSGTTVSVGLRYVPDPDANGTDTVTFEVCDDANRCDEADLTVNVAPIPDSPMVLPEAMSTAEDTTLVINVDDLLANDRDADNDPLHIDLVSATSGSATLDPVAGTISFVPALDDDTDSRVDYRVCDSTNRCQSTSVVIDLLPINDAPTLAPIANTTAEVGTAFSMTVIGSDVEGSPFTFSAGNLPPGLTIDPATGEISGTPEPVPVATGFAVSVRATETGVVPPLDGPSRAFVLTVNPAPPVDLRDALVISEVLYRASPGVNDEFVEITNISSTYVDLTGLKIMDGTPSPLATVRTMTATDSRGAPSLLAPGQSAVVWMNNPNEAGRTFPDAPASALSYHGPNGGAFAADLLSDPGDDIWLVEADDAAIDYIAYANPGFGTQILAAAPPAEWIGPVPADLKMAVAGQSISLTIRARSSDPACWERTGSGDAFGRCLGASVTNQVNTVVGDTRVASTGVRNID